MTIAMVSDLTVSEISAIRDRLMDKSINASKRLETAIIDRFICASDKRRHEFSEQCTSEPYYWRNIAPASGINPTHSLETAH